jgi:acetyl-CoA synthetase
MMRNLQRLLSPKSIAVLGGGSAEAVLRQLDKMGFAGKIWPVNPHRSTMEGHTCFKSLKDLPAVPDSAFVGVNRKATVTMVEELARMGAGGAVCLAAGFAEHGAEGHGLQAELLEAAGDMPFIGPNCYGLLNYLDGVALWPDLFGGERCERGVALIMQSGNIGLNLTMQQRSLPLAYMISVGNQASLGFSDYIEALTDDSRVSAIGMYVESLGDIEDFSEAARKALARKVPLVAIHSGHSEEARAVNKSHSASLAGAKEFSDALFRRYGISAVETPAELVETLKFFHFVGPLPGRKIVSLSCSGGEASLLADSLTARGFTFPPFAELQQKRIGEVMKGFETVSNPFDYNTGIWGDADRTRACFQAALEGDFDIAVLVIDFPNVQGAEYEHWNVTLRAFVDAAQHAGIKSAAVSGLSELLPNDVRRFLAREGVVPVQGLRELYCALSCVADYGAKQIRLEETGLPPPMRVARASAGTTFSGKNLDEATAKAMLKEHGLAPPASERVTLADLGEGELQRRADALGYPLVLKALGDKIFHKSEIGAVRIELGSAADVVAAVESMRLDLARHGIPLQDVLLERMIQDVVVEVMLGAVRDPQFGLNIVFGAGGILVELLAQSRPLLLPLDASEIEAAIDSLALGALLKGYRGKPAGDRLALVEAVLAFGGFCEAHAGSLLEIDVNPLFVLGKGQGVIVGDAVISASSDV